MFHNMALLQNIPQAAAPENGEYGRNQPRLDLVLPEEIWEMVLRNLKNSNDLLNASRASPVFSSILQKKRCIWMFDKVLPHIFKDLHKSDLLNLRFVCKTWNQALDNYVAEHPSLLPFNEQTFRTIQSSFNYLPLSTKVYDDIAFVNGEQFVVFMEKMNGHSRNPFFGHSIRIGSCGDLFDRMDDEVNFTWDGAVQLCKQFGSHLWHVEFANYEFAQSTLDFYNGIRKCLVNIPNLKSLHMNGALDACEEHDQQLLMHMENNSLPPLPHLDSIVFDLVMEAEPDEELFELQQRHVHLPQNEEAFVQFVNAHPEAIHQLLLEVPPTPDQFQDKFITTYGKQLKKLEIDLPSWRDNYGTLLDNLTELHLKHIYSISKLNSLLAGLKAGDKLGKLVISLRCSMTTAELFELLKTLRVLFLDFGYLGEAPDDYLVESLNYNALPNISSLVLLRIKDTVNMTYNFMKKLPSLEHLDVWECQNAKEQFLQQQRKKDGEEMKAGTNITEELRKLIYQEDCESGAGGRTKVKSNIWEMLPSLKLITYRTRSGLPQVIKRFARDSYSWEYICSY